MNKDYNTVNCIDCNKIIKNNKIYCKPCYSKRKQNNEIVCGNCKNFMNKCFWKDCTQNVINCQSCNFDDYKSSYCSECL